MINPFSRHFEDSPSDESKGLSDKIDSIMKRLAPAILRAEKETKEAIEEGGEESERDAQITAEIERLTGDGTSEQSEKSRLALGLIVMSLEILALLIKDTKGSMRALIRKALREENTKAEDENLVGFIAKEVASSVSSLESVCKTIGSAVAIVPEIAAVARMLTKRSQELMARECGGGGEPLFSAVEMYISGGEKLAAEKKAKRGV